MWLVPSRPAHARRSSAARDQLAPLDLPGEIDRFGADTLGGIGISVPAPA